MNISFRSYIKTTRFETAVWYSGLFLILEAAGGFIVYIYIKDNTEGIFENRTALLDGLEELYFIIAVISFLAAAAGGYYISRRSLSRIDKIIAETKKITSGNLDAKIEGEKYDDEYGRLVKTINEMIKRLKSEIDYVNQFSLAVQHEFRTPLTILRGEIELALKYGSEKEELEEVLKSNYEEVLRLIRMIEKLFFLSRGEHEEVYVRKERILLSEFLSMAAQEEINNMHYSGDLMIESEDDLYINVDVVLMQQAVINLLENAFKYGRPGEPVVLRGKRIRNKVRISVINKGEGIPADGINRIFEKFYRGEGSRNRGTGGMGLGLPIVKSIIDRHGGEIAVSSIIGGETEFSITLD